MKNFIIRLSFLVTALLFLTPSVSQAQIVGGSGFVKTASNPNGIASLTTIDQRYSASFAWDTTAQILYRYDRTLASGSRWVVMPSSATTDTDTRVTNFRVTGGNLLLDSINVKTGAILGTMSVAVTSIAPVQSVVGSGDVTVTSSAGVYTVAYTDLDKNPTNEAQTLSSSAVATNATTLNLTVVSGVGGGNVTVTGGTGITLTGTANNLTITNSAAPTIVADNPLNAAALGVAVGQAFIASLVNTMGVPAGTHVHRMF